VHMSGPSVGDTATAAPSQVSPNCQGSHQIPSVRRTAGVESSWVVNPIIDEPTSSRVGHRVGPRVPSCGYYHSGLPHLMVSKRESKRHESTRQSEYGKRYHTAFKCRSGLPDSATSPRSRWQADHGPTPLVPASNVPTHTGYPILSIAKIDCRCE